MKNKIGEWISISIKEFIQEIIKSPPTIKETLHNIVSDFRKFFKWLFK